MNNILCNYFYIMDHENKIIAENSNFLYFLVFLFLFIILSFSCSNTIFQNKNIDFEIDLDKYLVINDLTSVNHGVIEA